MNIKTLQERITKAEAKIEKKQNTIAKKQALRQKKIDTVVKKFNYKDYETKIHYTTAKAMGYDDETAWEFVDLLFDIEDLADDIKRIEKEIAETKNTIEKYNKQLDGEIEREAIFTREIPETMLKMQDELVAEWDRWDIEHREYLKRKYDELGYKAFIEKFKYAGYMEMHTTDEEFHKANLRSAKGLILNLYNRVKEITGEVTSWACIELEYGNQYFPVLTGVVTGKEGKARIETITAGGYNIQRLHIRTLVHEIH